MQRFDAVGLWLRNDLLPAWVIVLGGVLVLRCIRWAESRYQNRLDAQMAASIITMPLPRACSVAPRLADGSRLTCSNLS